MWTNQRLKALISAKSKKFIASEPTYLLQTFTSKAHNNLQDACFPNHDWRCHPWPPFCIISSKQLQKGGQGWQHQSWLGKHASCKLLCAFEVKVCNKYVGSLAINFLAFIKALSLWFVHIILGHSWYQSF